MRWMGVRDGLQLVDGEILRRGDEKFRKLAKENGWARAALFPVHSDPPKVACLAAAFEGHFPTESAHMSAQYSVFIELPFQLLSRRLRCLRATQ